MWLLFIGTFFSAFSQLLLKQSANKTYKNPIFEYLNWRVILSYGIFAAVLFLNTYAYTKVDMKYGEIQADAIRKAAVSKVMVFYFKRKVYKGKINWKFDYYEWSVYLYPAVLIFQRRSRL